MDIRVTSTGKVFYQVDSTLGAILCEAFPAAFERVGGGTPVDEERKMLRGLATSAGMRQDAQPNRPAAGQVFFSVVDNPHRGPLIQIRTAVGTYHYDGPVENIPATMMNHPVPEEIKAQFKAAKKQERR